MSGGFSMKDASTGDIARFAVEVGEAHNLLRELHRALGYKPQTLSIEVDASAVQEAIDKEMRDLGVLGELARVEVPEHLRGPQFLQATLTDALTYFNHDESGFYRRKMLLLAAQCLYVIKERDNEQQC